MFRIMSRLLIAILVCALPVLPQARRKPVPKEPAAAQPAPVAPAVSKWPIASLKVDGNKNYSEQDILTVAGLKIGDAAGKEEFEAARDRLIASGAFEQVGYRFDPVGGGAKGYAASFQVVEIQQVYPFRFESVHADTKAIIEHLKRTQPLFADKLPGTKQMLDRITKSVEEWLAKNNQKQTIIAKLSATGPGKLEIVIQPSSLPSVAEIHFTGNSVIGEQKLREAAAGPAVGAIYTDEKFREVLDVSVRPLYEAAGRLRAEWAKIDVVPAKDVKGLAVTVHVKEGDEFKLRNVEIAKPDAEDKEAIDEKVLLKEAKFETGEVANFNKVKQAVERMEQFLRRRGFIEVKSTTARTIDDKEKAVDLKLSLDPGPQFTFGKLTIQGLDIETEPHIRKIWAMKKGQPFNAEYPDFFLNKIREDGIFDNLGRTKSVIEPNPGNGTVDVTLTFAGEKPPKQPPRP
jgi:outer membrane protein insertion porin family